MKDQILLISVGGSPEPIIFALREYRPKGVIFFSSSETRCMVEDAILPALDYYPHCGHVVIVTPDHEDVGACTFELLRKVPEEMRKLGVPEDWPRLCGYTGGTKAMSAAVVWAASRFPCELLYVGGTNRSRDGVGIVENGSERMVVIENPWNRVGWFETRSAFELFNRCQYANATDQLKLLLDRMGDCEIKPALRYLLGIFQALSDWDGFRHVKALNAMEKAIKELPAIRALFADQFPQCRTLLNWLEPGRNHLRCLHIRKDGTLPLTETLLEELLSNTLRRARGEKKYEDATARLYALFEKEVKRRLQAGCGIDNSACPLERIPFSMREDYARHIDQETGCCKFGLKDSFRLLHELAGDEMTARFIEREQAISLALGRRNQSILGHGSQPVTETEFNELLQLVLWVLDRNEEDILQFPQL